MKEDTQKKEDYCWAFRHLQDLLWSNTDGPKVWVTDRDLAAKNTIEEAFPRTNLLLCTWHIDYDFETHAINCRVVLLRLNQTPVAMRPYL
jgi:hypothetical protein